MDLTDEQIEMLERIFKDARNSARDFNPEAHRGRLLDEIDDEITELRSALDLEI